MVDAAVVLESTLVVSGLLGWLLYFRESKYRRDVLTDLMQLVHDHDLTRDDLRRSLGWRDVEKQIDRQKDAD